MVYPSSPVPYNIFTNDLDDRAECSFRKFAGDTKLGEVADVPKGCAAIQMDLSSLEKWPDRNLKKFNKKCTSICCTPIIWKPIFWKTAWQKR